VTLFVFGSYFMRQPVESPVAVTLSCYNR